WTPSSAAPTGAPVSQAHAPMTTSVMASVMANVMDCRPHFLRCRIRPALLFIGLGLCSPRRPAARFSSSKNPSAVAAQRGDPIDRRRVPPHQTPGEQAGEELPPSRLFVKHRPEDGNGLRLPAD